MSFLFFLLALHLLLLLSLFPAVRIKSRIRRGRKRGTELATKLLLPRAGETGSRSRRGSRSFASRACTFPTRAGTRIPCQREGDLEAGITTTRAHGFPTLGGSDLASCANGWRGLAPRRFLCLSRSSFLPILLSRTPPSRD